MKNNKISFKTIFIDLIESFDVKQGLFITLKDVILNPGRVINYFIETRTNTDLNKSKYFSPLKLLTVVFALIAVASYLVGDNVLYPEKFHEPLDIFTEEELITEEYVDLNEYLNKWFQDFSDNSSSFTYTLLLSVLPLSFLSRLMFFRRREYNFAIHFVINTYIQSVILAITPFIYLFSGSSGGGDLVILLGLVFLYANTFKQVFKSSIIGGILKISLIFSVYYIVLIIVLLMVSMIGFYIPYYIENPHLL